MYSCLARKPKFLARAVWLSGTLFSLKIIIGCLCFLLIGQSLRGESKLHVILASSFWKKSGKILLFCVHLVAYEHFPLTYLQNSWRWWPASEVNNPRLDASHAALKICHQLSFLIWNNKLDIYKVKNSESIFRRQLWWSVYFPFVCRAVPWTM